jgi:signal transduction histidine kinase
VAVQPTVALTTTSHLATALLDATPIVVAYWPDESRFNQLPALCDQGVISSATVPIPGRPHSFGCLGVDVTAHRLLDDEEICFLQAVGNILALAVERFQLAETIDQRIEERTHAIEQLLVTAAQEQAVLEERQRLARELHDSVVQALYSVTLHAQGARRLLASGDLPTASDALNGLQETAQEALDEMRLLIFELRPPILEQVGLVAALQARLNSVEGRANLQTRLITDGVGDLPAPVEQALYRIVQEALNNVLKHAHAQHVTVRLQRASTAVLLDINDDGVGFEASTTDATGGMGLRGIAERAAQLAGKFSLQSAAGAGTYVHVEVPL